MKNDKKENALKKFLNLILDNMLAHPGNVTAEQRNILEKMYHNLCKILGISEHSQWRVTWEVQKWSDTARKIAGFAPDEVAIETQNIIVDGGANEMLKLISGTGGTAFSNANSYIFVGTDNTVENAAQTGVIAAGNNRAYAVMDAGYPIVSGRQMVYSSSFGDDIANFAWNEVSITNGIGANSVAMNRKVSKLGTKATGTWTIRVTVSLTSI